jgi:hypothetical protein
VRKLKRANIFDVSGMPDTCGNLDIHEKQFKSMNVKFCSAWTRFSKPDIPGERNFHL